MYIQCAELFAQVLVYHRDCLHWLSRDRPLDGSECVASRIARAFLMFVCVFVTVLRVIGTYVM